MFENIKLSREFTVGITSDNGGFIPVVKFSRYTFKKACFQQRQPLFLAFYSAEGEGNSFEDKYLSAYTNPKSFFLFGKLVEVFYEKEDEDVLSKVILQTEGDKYLEVQYSEDDFFFYAREVKPVKKTITVTDWE